MDLMIYSIEGEETHLVVGSFARMSKYLLALTDSQSKWDLFVRFTYLYCIHIHIESLEKD